MFQYSILKYYHSLALGEQINLGLLISSDQSEKIEFLYPRHLKRLSSVYSNISVNFLKHYLRDFEKRANELTRNEYNHVFKEFDLEDLIRQYFLVPDSNSLRFSKVRKAKQADYEKLKNYYYNAFLGEYEIKEETEKKDEKYVIKRVKDFIHKYNPDVEEKLKKDIDVSNKEWGVNVKFDLAWKNGSLNLLTPLGFDLYDPNSIIEKATRWYGTLSFLRDTAKQENYSFDILLTKPRKREFFSSYDNALKILNELNAPKNIYQEDEIEKYLNNLVSTIQS